MQLRFFTIPIYGGEALADDLNRFLAGSRILSIDRQLAQDGANSAWSVCVAFETAGAGRPSQPGGGERPRREKVDYREVLNEQDFSLYARLRTLRKGLAEGEGVPVYALFSNEQLAAMVQGRVTDKAALRAIPGIGDARIERYADAFLAILCEAPAAAPAPDAPRGGA